ncbi:MAG: hypothetical protein GY730_02755 [bacterium]|nr:hypothetical protein [bacterium]
MEKKNSFAYSRKILLPPAIGDWTTSKYRDTDNDEINISHVQNINFDSLPRDQLKYVQYLHYRLAENITKKLSEDMDIKIEIHSIKATQATYKDFLEAQKSKLIQANFLIEKMGKVNVIFDWVLAEMIVDRLTGGKGEPGQSESFSDIEISILKTQIDNIVPFFSSAWKSVIKEDKIKNEFVCGKYNRDKKISLREAYIIFTFNLYFGKGNLRSILWAYPSNILRELLLLRRSLPNPVNKRIMLMPQTLQKIKVLVKAYLGKATLTMRELMDLQVGDVIALDSSIEEPLQIDIEGNVKFFVQPGVVANKVCTQLIFWDGAGDKPLLRSRPVISEKKKASINKAQRADNKRYQKQKPEMKSSEEEKTQEKEAFKEEKELDQKTNDGEYIYSQGTRDSEDLFFGDDELIMGGATDKSGKELEPETELSRPYLVDEDFNAELDEPELSETEIPETGVTEESFSDEQAELAAEEQIEEQIEEQEQLTIGEELEEESLEPVSMDDSLPEIDEDFNAELDEPELSETEIPETGVTEEGFAEDQEELEAEEQIEEQEQLTIGEELEEESPEPELSETGVTEESFSDEQAELAAAKQVEEQIEEQEQLTIGEELEEASPEPELSETGVTEEGFSDEQEELAAEEQVK